MDQNKIAPGLTNYQVQVFFTEGRGDKVLRERRGKNLKVQIPDAVCVWNLHIFAIGKFSELLL